MPVFGAGTKFLKFAFDSVLQQEQLLHRHSSTSLTKFTECPNAFIREVCKFCRPNTLTPNSGGAPRRYSAPFMLDCRDFARSFSAGTQFPFNPSTNVTILSNGIAISTASSFVKAVKGYVPIFSFGGMSTSLVHRISLTESLKEILAFLSLHRFLSEIQLWSILHLFMGCWPAPTD